MFLFSEVAPLEASCFEAASFEIAFFEVASLGAAFSTFSRSKAKSEPGVPDQDASGAGSGTQSEARIRDHN